MLPPIIQVILKAERAKISINNYKYNMSLDGEYRFTAHV